MTNETMVKGTKFATNDRGEGLFYWGKIVGDIYPTWIQIKGTCDFSVRGLKNPKAKIRRAVIR